MPAAAMEASLQDSAGGDGGAPAGVVLDDKITILKGHAADLSAATFCLMEEDHTLGNALRWMLMKDPQVEFCGYSNPHPSEPKIHLRVQMYDGASSLAAVKRALDSLEALFLSLDAAYAAGLEECLKSSPSSSAPDAQASSEDRASSGAGAASGATVYRPPPTTEQLREMVRAGDEIRQRQLDERRAARAQQAAATAGGGGRARAPQ